MQLDAEGCELQGDSSTVEMNLDHPAHERIMREGLSLTCDLQTRPGTSRVRVVVRD